MSGQPEAVGEEEPAQRDSFTIQHPASSGGTAVAEALEVLAVHSTSSSNPASGFSFPTLPALSTSTAQQQQLPLTARSTVSHASAPLTAQSTVRDASAPLTAQSTVRDASGPPSTSQPAAALQPAVPIVVKAKPDVRRNKDQCTRALYGFLSRFFPVMLEKGYSQMDWLKLGRTNKDLNGLHGAPPQRGITMAEVARHASREDMWMVLRGKVYNVTPYLGFHPGGADVMMKAAGRDGTVLFNKFHPWVNGDALMEKCLVGWLEEKAVADS